MSFRRLVMPAAALMIAASAISSPVAATAAPAVPTAKVAAKVAASIPAAHAAPTRQNRPSRSVSARVRGQAVISVARSLSGIPYVRGGATPGGFDCSGYTMYVYRKALGVNLPHYTQAQMASTRRISAAEAVPGDLVFFWRGGYVYHAAIYAGGHKIYHSSRPGHLTGLANIWTGGYSFGRVG